MELAEAYRQENGGFNIGDEITYLNQKAIITNITIRTEHFWKYYCLYFPELEVHHIVKDWTFNQYLGGE